MDDSTFSLPSDEQTDVNLLQSASVNEIEVENILESLDPCKANGPDGISSRLLKEATPVISKSLTNLFNLSVDTGFHLHGNEQTFSNFQKKRLQVLAIVRDQFRCLVL